MHRVLGRSFVVFASLAVGAALLQSPAAALPNCGALAPVGGGASDVANLQACLDAGGTINLASGSTFLIDQGLVVKRSSTILTSPVAGTRATVKAMPSLSAAMLTLPHGATVTDLQVTHIAFDGDRANRLNATRICAADIDRGNGSNVRILSGTRHVFADNRSTNALCGAALQISADPDPNSSFGFKVLDNVIDNNGLNQYPAMNPNNFAPQADGITISICSVGTVERNVIVDATDVGIVSFGSQGQSCLIRNNTIRQVSRHAYNGIGLGRSNKGDIANHGNTIVSGNTVTGNQHMSIGIEYGTDAFFGYETTQVVNATITDNDVTGAFLGIQVQGVVGGSVTSNTPDLPAVPIGGPAPCAAGRGAPTRYSAYPPRAIGTTLDPGYVVQDWNGCLP